jgi:aminobutyraldehyde dehydrogenase
VELPTTDGSLEDRPHPGGRQLLVIKPSEQTPLTTLKFAELVADLLPAGVFNVVTGYGSVVGNRLSGHTQIDMIALTGSVNSERRWHTTPPSRSSSAVRLR